MLPLIPLGNEKPTSITNTWLGFADPTSGELFMRSTFISCLSSTLQIVVNWIKKCLHSQKRKKKPTKLQPELDAIWELSSGTYYLFLCWRCFGIINTITPMGYIIHSNRCFVRTVKVRIPVKCHVKWRYIAALSQIVWVICSIIGIYRSTKRILCILNVNLRKSCAK